MTELNFHWGGMTGDPAFCEWPCAHIATHRIYGSLFCWPHYVRFAAELARLMNALQNRIGAVTEDECPRADTEAKSCARDS